MLRFNRAVIQRARWYESCDLRSISLNAHPRSDRLLSTSCMAESVQEFFDVIFKDETAIKIYHKLNSSEEGARVTPWDNGTRTVEFYKEMQLPAPISSFFSESD